MNGSPRAGALLGLAACLSVAFVAVQAAAQPDPAALMKADRAFSDAAAKGLEEFGKFVAEEVSTLRPDVPIITGKKAFSERWAPLLTDPNMSIRWEPVTAAISDAGDLGYTVGTYEVRRREPEGLRVVATGKYVTIWKLQGDGSFKVVFDSGVQDAPPEAAKKP